MEIKDAKITNISVIQDIAGKTWRTSFISVISSLVFLMSRVLSSFFVNSSSSFASAFFFCFLRLLTFELEAIASTRSSFDTMLSSLNSFVSYFRNSKNSSELSCSESGENTLNAARLDDERPTVVQIDLTIYAYQDK